MNEQQKIYFSVSLDVRNCKNNFEKLESLSRIQQQLSVISVWDNNVGFFIFPVEGETKVECVNPAVVLRSDEIQKKIDEGLEKLNKLLSTF